jgi:hypothetical protein
VQSGEKRREIFQMQLKKRLTLYSGAELPFLGLFGEEGVAEKGDF